MTRPDEVSEYREFLIKSLLDNYVKYLMGLSNDNMDDMIKAEKITLREVLE